jgi:hypothetical protein
MGFFFGTRSPEAFAAYKRCLSKLPRKMMTCSSLEGASSYQPDTELVMSQSLVATYSFELGRPRTMGWAIESTV